MLNMKLIAYPTFVVHLFPTGQGNIIGNPIEPVIKLRRRPPTCHFSLRAAPRPSVRA